MKRQNRLQSAKHWILTYTGNNIVKDYRKCFGVDLPCAIHELKTLGVKLNDEYVRQALQCREHEIASRRRKIEEKKKYELAGSLIDSDENFYYIAGYTSVGFPYGIAWGEADAEGIE